MKLCEPGICAALKCEYCFTHFNGHKPRIRAQPIYIKHTNILISIAKMFQNRMNLIKSKCKSKISNN